MKIKQFAIAAALITNSCGIPAAFADPPDQGSKQWQRMAPYAAFITSMHDKNGSFCCNISDGRMGDGAEELKEFQETDKDGNATYYVFIERKIFAEDSHNPHNPNPLNHSYDNAIPPEGKIFKVDADHVLLVDNKDVRRCLNKNSDNCIAPENNAVWLSTSGDIFCYWPQQRWTQNVVKQFARLQR